MTTAPTREAAADTRDPWAIQALVQCSATLLDQEALEDWLALFHPDGQYEIRAHSTELGRDVVWWLADVPALTRTLGEVKQHVRDQASRRRVLGLPQIEWGEAEARVEVPVAVYRTSPQGETSLYVVGRYQSTLVPHEGAWRYREHRMLLDTRVLEAFTHLPL